jgi:predicted MPP superfamily phosphohydrolase
MIIRYLSDLHLELIKPQDLIKIISKLYPNPNKEEICVLAGDIGNPYKSNYDNFMKHVSSIFVKTFVITGNHEYYNNNKTIEETNIFLENYFKQFKNISFLNNSHEYYNSHYFIGTTL